MMFAPEKQTHTTYIFDNLQELHRATETTVSHTSNKHSYNADTDYLEFIIDITNNIEYLSYA